jgi:hypothetical protein
MIFSKKLYFLMLIFSFLSCVHGFAEQSPGDSQPLEAKPTGTDAVLASSVPADCSLPATEEALAGLTPEERRWYYRFQEGVLFFDGWKKITRAVVEKFPEHEREKRLAAMRTLGYKIGYEWSRDDRVRKVNTDMLRAWGKDLRKAGAENHVQLAKVLYEIDREVATLLR